MLWAAAKATDDPVTREARTAAEARDADESKRLLYVALTRAEDWLILCGAGLSGKTAGTWYELLEQGMDALGGAAAVTGPEGLADPVRRREDNPVPVNGAPEDAAAGEAVAPLPSRPAWLANAPHEERSRRTSPSSLGEPAEEGGAGLGRTLAL